MFPAKRAVLCGLAAVALSACASTNKPPAGALNASGKSAARGKIDDARKKHFLCLKQHHIRATEPTPLTIQVGTTGVGPLVRFLSTPGAAQYAQISDEEQGAEVIGSSLLYPNQASSSELKIVETCTALGVNG